MPDRISVDFGSLNNNELLNRGGAVVLALEGSVKYTNPPVTMAMLKSLLVKFDGAVVDAMEGNKSARVVRDSLRDQVISALQQVAKYVQENSGGDPSGTGFKTYGNKRKPPQPVTTPKFRKLYHGARNSGIIMGLINAVPGARGYEVQYAVLQNDVPGPWTSIDVMNVKSAFTVSGLTLVAQYAFRVRAIGVINKSDWSDIVPIICA